MRFYIFLILFFIHTSLLAQYKVENLYLDDYFDECDSINAVYKLRIEYNDSTLNTGSEWTLRKTILIQTLGYIDLKDIIIDGTATYYYLNGTVKAKRSYRNGKLHGKATSYYANGLLKRRDYYSNGNFLNGNCYAENGKDTTYYDFTTPAQFPDGQFGLNNFLREKIRYNAQAAKKGIEGKVIVTFIINEEGVVEDINVMQSANYLLDNEAIRVVKIMPKWVPGTFDGENIKRKFTLPIIFKLAYY